jgi:hypothetical protein
MKTVLPNFAPESSLRGLSLTPQVFAPRCGRGSEKMAWGGRENLAAASKVVPLRRRWLDSDFSMSNTSPVDRAGEIHFFSGSSSGA